MANTSYCRDNTNSDNNSSNNNSNASNNNNNSSNKNIDIYEEDTTNELQKPIQQRDEDEDYSNSINELIPLLIVEEKEKPSNNNNNNNSNNTKHTDNMVSSVGVGSGGNSHSSSSSSTTTTSTFRGSFTIRMKRMIDFVLLVLLRLIVLWPIRTIQSFLFPFPETDELSPAVTAKAAAQFVLYLKSVAVATNQHHHQPNRQQNRQQNQYSNNNNNNNNLAATGITNTSTTRTTTGSTTSNTNNSNVSSIVGRINDAWYIGGFEGAQQEAIMKRCLLLVYLHSPFHRMSDEIVTKLLNTNEFLDFLCPVSMNQQQHNNNNSNSNHHHHHHRHHHHQQEQQQQNHQPQVVAIGVSIHTTQGIQLAHRLQVTSYPALVLLQPEGSTSVSSTTGTTTSTTASSRSSRSIPVQLILRAESPYHLTLSKLLPHLYTAVTRYQVIVTEREMRKIQREQEIELRKQQDEEYLATLLADQERELRIQQEAAMKEQQIQAALVAEQNRIQEYEAKKRSIRPEPPISVPTSTSSQKQPRSGTSTTGSTPPITTIRFVLPNGTKLNRRFYAEDDTIGILRAFIEVYYHETPGYDDIGTVGLSTNVFPRTTYNDPEQTSLSLKDAGLYPQGVLMVQDLDA